MVMVFLAGDVMTGRGVDQIMAVSCPPELREPYVEDARTYVGLAEEINGAVPAPVDAAYVWGDALPVLRAVRPGASVVNLETNITRSNDFWPGKAVHYRMHPANAECLVAAGIDVCALANNHMLDFGRAGLAETLEVLRQTGIRTAGAGSDALDASALARIELSDGRRLLVFSVGSVTSGIPFEWAAGPKRSGVHLVRDLSRATADGLLEHIQTTRAPGDLVITSIHWGGNWGWDTATEEIAFAHRLIDGGVDLVHGHSSHHVRAIERYRDRLILYGCGDLITDYEGIRGHTSFRGDLGALYLAELSTDGELVGLRLIPTQMKRLRLSRPRPSDIEWLRRTLDRLSRPLGSSVALTGDGALELRQA